MTEQEILSEKISFTYQDQVDFSNNYRNTLYDCEAFLFDGDSLVLLTKDWLNYHTALYKISVLPGHHIIKKFDEFNSDGLITGADYDLQRKSLILCGYNDYIPFVIQIDSFQSDGIQKLSSKRYDLHDDFGLQLEGIAFFNDQIFLTSENAITVQAFYRLTTH
ncbi:hypothetical protein ES705_21772 [subsurface metagenome]